MHHDKKAKHTQANQQCFDIVDLASESTFGMLKIWFQQTTNVS